MLRPRRPRSYPAGPFNIRLLLARSRAGAAGAPPWRGYVWVMCFQLREMRLQ